MIDTFFALGQLDSSKGLFMSLLIGILFGLVLERAGFGSSKRLSGVFYFRDMAVIKVMFTAMITAILGIALCLHLGIVTDLSIYLNPTIYTAQILGGLLFGVGFVMGGWCPGTAAVGAASGKWDAFVFLGGTIGGSLLFNETYTWAKGFYDAGQAHTAFVYQSLGISKDWFVLFFVLVGVLVFWGMERIEHRHIHDSPYVKSGFLNQFSFVLILVGFCVFMLVQDPFLASTSSDSITASEQELLSDIDNGLDHIEPEDLAQRVITGQKDLILVDVRPASEFFKFHIKTARNILLKDLVSQLEPHRNQGMIVLYSNGMTHPAQARDALSRMGFTNVYLLTDGLNGFVSRCLKPISLRSEPVPGDAATEINRWRQFFLMSDLVAAKQTNGVGTGITGSTLPGLIDAPGLLYRRKI